MSIDSQFMNLASTPKKEAADMRENTEAKKIRTIEVGGRQIDVFEKDGGLIGLEELDRLAEKNKKSGGENAKKVLFIDFKTLDKMPENENYSFQNFVNLGLHRLEGYLNHYGVPVTIARFNDLRNNPDKLAELLQSHDIIGVSNLTGQVEDTYSLCRAIKSKFGDEKLVIGGGEHYLAQDYILADSKNTGIDACCQGQGELPILALALGQSKERVGSISYRDNENGSTRIIQNKQFKRLVNASDQSNVQEILNVTQATPFSLEEISGAAPFNELNGLDDFKFDGTFVTQTGSGCEFACDFCPSKKFFGSGYESNLDVAKQEILEFKKSFPNIKEAFLTFSDAMLNPSGKKQEGHLQQVINFMKKVNDESGPKISWFAYLSVPHRLESESPEVWRSRWDKILAEMAAAGCIMAGVGVEEVIYDRKETHHKGGNMAPEFIDLVGKHMLTRSLLILGGPAHMYLERDKTIKGEDYLEKYAIDRDLIKGEILEFMKAHPQALYRTNPWTLVYGTDDFYKYRDCLAIDTGNPSQLKELDHLHSVIDPEKMYKHIEMERDIIIPEEKKWVKNKEVWFELMEEIMEEYLSSSEYADYIETLKEKVTRGQKGLLHKLALKFKGNALNQIGNNRKKRTQ